MNQLDLGAARRVTLSPGGGRIAALQSGDTGAPPVLLVPGYTGSKEDFAPILDAVARAGFLVTAVDLPGQYESPGPADPADYAPDRLGAVVLELARLLGAPVRLLGHSFGGLVARAATIADPAAISSLVLLSSGPAAIGGGRRSSIDLLDPVLDQAGLPGVYAAMLTDPGYVAPPPALAEFLQRRFVEGSAVMLRGMGNAIRVEPDRVAELAATGVPVLVAHGVDDDAWPPAVQAVMAQRLGARYVVLPSAAHSAAVENPAATVSTLLDFWGPAA